MANNQAEPVDKLAVLLARNDDRLVELTKKVEKLIAKLSSANGKPITVVDRAKAALSTVAVSGATIMVLLTLLTLWDRMR